LKGKFFFFVLVKIAYKDFPANVKKKLFYIDKNGELSQEEKWRAKDRLLGLPLGTHKAEQLALEEAEETRSDSS